MTRADAFPVTSKPRWNVPTARHGVFVTASAVKRTKTFTRLFATTWPITTRHMSRASWKRLFLT